MTNRTIDLAAPYDIGDLATLQAGVERHHHPAGALDADRRRDPFPHVRRPDRGAIAGAGAVGNQRLCNRIGTLIQFAITGRAIGLRHHGGSVAITGSGIARQGGNGRSHAFTVSDREADCPAMDARDSWVSSRCRNALRADQISQEAQRTNNHQHDRDRETDLVRIVEDIIGDGADEHRAEGEAEQIGSQHGQRGEAPPASPPARSSAPSPVSGRRLRPSSASSMLCRQTGCADRRSGRRWR